MEWNFEIQLSSLVQYALIVFKWNCIVAITFVDDDVFAKLIYV